MTRILLVEDDATLAMAIEYTLKNEGYKVDVAESLGMGKDLVNYNSYNLILLDIMLPDGSGFDLCEYVRKDQDTPIIFLTVQDEEVNIVMGLDMGGDDYITKPFRIKELLSRIKAILRRTSNPSIGEVLISANIRLNILEAKAFNKKQLLALTPSEYRLLIFLMNHPHQALSRSKLLQNLWDFDGEFVDDNSLSVYIRRLREKIETNPSSPQYIKTIRGLGYLWDMDVRR